MKIEKIFVFILVLLIGLSIVHAEPIPRDFSLQVTLVNQEPDPVEPGSYVDVRFKFENLGSSEAEDITVEIVEEYPFSLNPGESPIKKIGSVNGRQVGDTGVIVKYRLKIDENAVEGENELKLRYKTDNFDEVEEDFDINIRTTDAIISVDSVKAEPELIMPGGDSVVSIEFTNMADSVLKDIKLKLDLTDIDLAPSASTNEITVKSMDPGETKTVEFMLTAGPDAESSLYKVPLSIEYKDELANEYTLSNSIGLRIGDSPDLIVNIEDSQVVTKNTKGTVTVQFINKGVSDIKFVFVKLRETDQFEIIGLDEAYVGKIDSDDYETADFTIYAKSGEDIILPVEMEYRDANNNLFTETKNLKIKIYDKRTAQKLGLVPQSNIIGMIITLAIIAGGVYLFLRWRKKKKEKKKSP